MLPPNMGAVTGSRAQSSRFGAPRLGRLLIEQEVAKGPASTVLAARVASDSGEPSATRVAVKGYDLALRVGTPDASRFEGAIDSRILRSRRVDETGVLPKDRLYRVTDLVQGEPGVLATLGSLRALVAFWAEVARILGVAHDRGLAHGHVHPGHALVLGGAEKIALVSDPGVVLTPQAARARPSSAELLAPEAIEELLADRPAPATKEADVYSLGASVQAALGGRPGPAATLEELLARKKRAPRPAIAAATVGRGVDGRKLAQVLARALAPERDQRQSDGGELGEALASVLEDRGK
jgi:hypothetical protein